MEILPCFNECPFYVYIIDDDYENNKPVVHSMVDGAPTSTSAGTPINSIPIWRQPPVRQKINAVRASIDLLFDEFVPINLPKLDNDNGYASSRIINHTNGIIVLPFMY